MAVSQTIATIPPAPSRADPANFVERHEAVLDRLETLPGEMNTWKNQVNTTQSAINASELQAGQSATTATNAASLALTYSNAEQYAAGTTYAPGETAIGSNGTAYRRLNTSAAGDNPVTSTTGNWTPAITALGAMSTFDLICRIAGMAPTLYLNFKEQDYRHYSSTKGLEKKALADILTFTRGSDGGIFNARSQYEALSTNEPRLDFDPETGVGRGLLVEESRTNLLAYSEQFDNAGWLTLRLTVAPSSITDPSGNTNAFLLSADGYADQSIVRAETTTVGGTYCLSAFFKQGTTDSVIIQILTDVWPNRVSCVYTFSSSSHASYSYGAAAVIGAGAEGVGGGWVRVWVACNTESTSTGIRIGLYGSDLETGYCFGAQLEEGAFPTTYIPTTTAAATRATDVIKIDGTAFSDFYSQTEGTFFVNYEWNFGSGQGNFSRLFECYNENSNDTIMIRAGSAACYVYMASAGVQQFAQQRGAYGAPLSCALAVQKDNSQAAVNGEMFTLTSAMQMPVGINKINIGSAWSNATPMNGLNRVLCYFPKRLPNATLQQLSALVI